MAGCAQAGRFLPSIAEYPCKRARSFLNLVRGAPAMASGGEGDGRGDSQAARPLATLDARPFSRHPYTKVPDAMGLGLSTSAEGEGPGSPSDRSNEHGRSADPDRQPRLSRSHLRT